MKLNPKWLKGALVHNQDLKSKFGVILKVYDDGDTVRVWRHGIPYKMSAVKLDKEGRLYRLAYAVKKHLEPTVR